MPVCQVGVNLGTPGAYLKTIEDATADLDVTILFNNAGFMVTGFFDKTCVRADLLPVPASPVRLTRRRAYTTDHWARIWRTWSATP